MRRILILIVTLLFCSLIPGTSLAVIYTVPATANIFSAGLSSPIAPGGDGAGTLPISVPVYSNQGNGFQFQASGSISYYYDQFFNGPDGATVSMNINSYGGISGYFGPALALVGVFLTDAAPQAPAPSILDFSTSGLGRNFPAISPQIGQLFFIGDGQTDGELIQTIVIPTGATRLFLGVPDCLNGIGDPGYYGDNQGSLSVAVNQVPEPASVALIELGVALLLGVRRRTTVLVRAVEKS